MFNPLKISEDHVGAVGLKSSVISQIVPQKKKVVKISDPLNLQFNIGEPMQLNQIISVELQGI